MMVRQIINHQVHFQRVLLAGCFLWCITTTVAAQKYSGIYGQITFFSEAPLENIKAENSAVRSILNLPTQELAITVTIRQFKFEKKLMQEHFNDKYMESHKYPTATFTGRLENFNLGQRTQTVRASGKLTIHGVIREVNIPGTVDIDGDKIVLNAKFSVRVEDYKIKIPKLLWQNIAEEVEVTVALSLIKQ